ncbi:hypothetical protein GCM10009557_05720 [Virgisporangium ochraceum]|uniref:Uncharacterized protein n=1 Tax=Virgisporangium ochraceum TaxID=65505 RepID=A0A8J3ZKY0_9ACTN|nr:hypothetical protein [Virgisporangium ochraceum]GIJ66229.1 hypothetical protein Voc01_011460 [Virgisporangium ochraceum]
MTETMYTRDLRVIWWPSHEAFTLPDAEHPWTVARSGDTGLWHGYDAHGDASMDVSRKTHPDEVIHGIIGEPQDATNEEAFLLLAAQSEPMPQSVAYDTLAAGKEMDHLIERGLFEQVIHNEVTYCQLTEAGAAKAAMLA